MTSLNWLYIEVGYKGVWIALNFSNWNGDNCFELWVTWGVAIVVLMGIALLKKRSV